VQLRPGIADQQDPAALETEGPSTVTIQEAAYAAGGQNGWHSHPGMVIVTVISGSIIWYDENCTPTTYKAGDSWVEGGQLHGFKVISVYLKQLADTRPRTGRQRGESFLARRGAFC
jgi:quercetin dioxygenase-like cupin family protein